MTQTNLAPVINGERVAEAAKILQRYKQGKANLERKVIENEQWYKLRHWECMEHRKSQVEPTSAWLFNCIANKHADAMDNYPSPSVLPREETDKGEAKLLSSIIPVILDQVEFEQIYSDVQHHRLKNGTGVYGVFWDRSKNGGLGDISVTKTDILKLFWEPGITDIQQSRNVFQVELWDNDILEDRYPFLKEKLGASTVDVAKYVYDDTVDTSGKSCVVDWYYKTSIEGRTVLHYCKFVNNVVLFATENDPEFATRGLYDHGMYPFVFDVLFPLEGTPAGFGYVDVGKDAQGYIDRGNQAILQNLLVNARPRHFIRKDGSVNEEEYTDLSKDLIHVDGNLGQDSIQPVRSTPLSEVYLAIINNKVDELKETTGNRDVSTGGSSGGVTAASAIAALQEAGSKLSRDSNKTSYRAFKKVVIMIIELIRQFYDLPRCFRIMGPAGATEYVKYSNRSIKKQAQGMVGGMDMGYRLPLFDVEVTAQKQSPYSKMSQNELALQFYQAGFFDPRNYTAATACLDMMDFDRKDIVMTSIKENREKYVRATLMGMARGMGGKRGTPTAKLSEGAEPKESVEAKERVAEASAP
jgi:hypothetical protein